MPNQIEYRPYFPGDEKAILDLFQVSYGKEMSMDYWQWRFRDNINGQIMIELAWDEETLVSHYAVSPVVLTVKGQDYITALSMTTMTHPCYSGRGLFPILSSRLYERLRKCSYLIVWGFPNNQSHRTFINQLAWEDIYEIPTLHLSLYNLPVIPEISEHIMELTEFDKRFDKLWDNIRVYNDVWVKRNQKYLNWRYILNPQNQYKILVYTEKNELLGYVVFKEHNSYIDIVDLSTVREDKIGKELVLAVINISRQQSSIKGINIWLSVHYSLHHKLEKIGFINSMPVTYFGARILDKSKPNNADAKTFHHWHIQMGDSDVY